MCFPTAVSLLGEAGLKGVALAFSIHPQADPLRSPPTPTCAARKASPATYLAIVVI